MGEGVLCSCTLELDYPKTGSKVVNGVQECALRRAVKVRDDLSICA